MGIEKSGRTGSRVASLSASRGQEKLGNAFAGWRIHQRAMFVFQGGERQAERDGRPAYRPGEGGQGRVRVTTRSRGA